MWLSFYLFLFQKMIQKIPKNLPKKFTPFDFLKKNSPRCQNSSKKKKSLPPPTTAPSWQIR
jgi:hypothetical protein